MKLTIAQRRQALRDLQAQYGRAKSEKKAAASRANGKLGGRPKKKPESIKDGE